MNGHSECLGPRDERALAGHDEMTIGDGIASDMLAIRSRRLSSAPPIWPTGFK